MIVRPAVGFGQVEDAGMARASGRKPIMKMYAMAGNGPAVSRDETTQDDETLQRIGDLAKQFDVTLRTLRFYEDKGLLAPKREGTTRLYSRRDRARLKLILLGRRVGFSLRDVKHMIDLYDPTGTNARQLRLALEKSEKQMTKLHKQRQAIDDAITDLAELIGNVRQSLATASVTRLNG